jgi:hypothetical protein
VAGDLLRASGDVEEGGLGIGDLNVGEEGELGIRKAGRQEGRQEGRGGLGIGDLKLGEEEGGVGFGVLIGTLLC